MAATSVYVPRVIHSCHLLLQETLQDQQVGLAQAPIKLLLLPWVPVHVRFCVCPLRVKSLFPRTPEIKPQWPSKPNFLGADLPSAGPPGWGA